ncbi:centromere protein L-like [Copidosoma floridanum]|uniref:centromere protein L-like n=1 Tax=Copidosoma floridanum TaxID=29053 RepID=UPI0006C98721|nr:centromere protein L-like [Copidosoma floridanum]
MESNNEPNESGTCVFSRTAAYRESRKCFSLVSRTQLGAGDGDDYNFDEDDNPLLDLEELLKQTWNIHGVSILFNFHSDNEVLMKQYAKKLREEVATILSQENVTYNAKITVLNIRRPKETDHPVVKIEVFATVFKQGSKDQSETTVYKGYLISWRTETSEAPTWAGSTRLPLLLCRGTPNTMRAVHATLGRMFDCMFVLLSASAEDLRWLLPILISPCGGHDKPKKGDEAKLKFLVPGLPKSNSITIKFLVKDLAKMWKCFLGKDTIEAEEVDKFHEIIHTQILEISSLQLGLCILNRLDLPLVTITENKMKAMDVETMNTVLAYFNEKALDTLHINIIELDMSNETTSS